MNEDQLPEEIVAWIKLNNPRHTMEGSYDFQKDAEMMYHHLKSHTVEGEGGGLNNAQISNFISWIDSEIKFSLDNWTGRSKSHTHPRKVRATAMQVVRHKLISILGYDPCDDQNIPNVIKAQSAPITLTID